MNSYKLKLSQNMSGIFRAISALLILSTISLTSCGFASDENTSNASYISQMEIPSLKENYGLALSKAQAWHDDAYVFWADVSINNKNVFISYIFGSTLFPQDEKLVEIRLDGDTKKITTFESTIDPPSRKNEPIPIEDSVLDAPEVFKMALQHSGSSLISSHQNITDILIQLVPLSGAAAEEIGRVTFQPVWRVALSNSTKSINLLFDPFTGDFLGSINRE
jgi:hypothetical protein